MSKRPGEHRYKLTIRLSQVQLPSRNLRCTLPPPGNIITTTTARLLSKLFLFANCFHSANEYNSEFTE